MKKIKFIFRKIKGFQYRLEFSEDVNRTNDIENVLASQQDNQWVEEKPSGISPDKPKDNSNTIPLSPDFVKSVYEEDDWWDKYDRQSQFPN